MRIRSERAKIFAPFSPLREMNAAYRENEKIITPKSELLSDRTEEIDMILKQINKGCMVNVTYYDNGEYKKRSGKVYSISPQKRMFIMEFPIYFEDIYDIEIKDTLDE